MQLITPSRILVSTDFSDLATYAVRYAASIASRAKARLTVLYADTFLPPPHFTYAQVTDIANSLEVSKQQAKEELDRYVKEHVPAGIEVETVVVEDLPVSAILDAAEERNVDLIVMGTHGRSGLSRVMLGSVAERVLRETNRPVLTARESTERPAGRIAKILCPMNFSDAAKDALVQAVSLAKLYDAELIVLHVVEPQQRVVTQHEMEQLCSWIPDDVRSRCEFQQLELSTHPAEQIIGAARTFGADLLVIGAQHRRFTDTTIIGTTTVQVTRHAPSPVLTVVRRADVATLAKGA
ncbi:MAG: universal stress protein [Thermoanaerobaculia bacterium]